MTMTLVETITVGSGGVATLNFTAIPQTATDILLLGFARSTNNNGNLYMTLNGSSIGSGVILRGTGAGTQGNTGGEMYLRTNSTDTASVFSNFSTYISNYAVSGNKRLITEGVTENNGTGAYQSIAATVITTAAGITTLTIQDGNSGSLAQYSSFSLYMITKGSGGATVS